MSVDNSVMARLEEKIEEIVQKVAALQRENADLKQQVYESQAMLTELEAKDKELNDLNELLAVQDAERAEIRSRVEALVAKLEGPKGE